MKFADYSPPAAPSLKQQRDALRKGLGRAVQWALSGRLSEKPLLDACLRDQRFEVHTNDMRGDWLWRMIRAVGATKRFRRPILHAIRDLSHEDSAYQLCELARHYAESGDKPFRTRLREIVVQKPIADTNYLGEEELIALEGKKGFLLAAQVRGRQLADREWDCNDGHIVDLAVEQLGGQRVRRLLAASKDEAIIRFRKLWLRDKRESLKKKRRSSSKQRMRAIPVENVLQAAQSRSWCYWLNGWGKYANEADLQPILTRLWKEKKPKVIANLVNVFTNRALPEFDTRLIELCRHRNKTVRRRAHMAAAMNTHPLVREFALSKLRRGIHDKSAIILFCNNYQRGDEERIQKALKLPSDVAELHWLLMDVIKVLEKNPEADCSRLGVVAYALTPCSFCRHRVVKLLVSRKAVPEWMKAECRHDAEEECRKLFEHPTKAARLSVS